MHVANGHSLYFEQWSGNRVLVTLPLAILMGLRTVTEKDRYDVLELKALRCFWATGRLGSLTQAGIELGISEAAISQRIKSLEGYLGTKLYESRGGKIQLTAAGQHTLDMSIVLFDQLQEFEAVVSAQSDVETLTLSANEPVLRYFLPEIVKRFSEKHPLTRLRLLSRRFAETVQLVQSNDADLGVIPEHRLSKDLVFHPMRTYKAYLLLPHGHPLTRRGPPAIESLLTEEIISRYPLIVAETDDPEHDPIRKVLEDQGLPYNVRLEAGTVDTLKYYVSQGQGLAVVSGMCLTEEDSRSFAALQIPDELWEGTTYGVIHRADKHLSTPLAGLLALMGVNKSEEKNSQSS